MDEFINKKVKILIDAGTKNLFYSAIITEVTKTHVSFRDKFGGNYTYRKDLILQISEDTNG